MGYAIFLVDLAAAAGALGVYVAHNEFYHKQGAGLLPYRGVPLINTETLLHFVDPESDVVDLPFEMENLYNPYVVLKREPVSLEDCEPKQCQDFSLSAKGVATDRGYGLIVGDREQEEICTMFYTPSQGGCTGKTSSSGRVDYRALKAMRA